MERTPRTLLLTAIGILFFIFILIFGYHRFGRYIDGPEITSISIKDYQSIDTFSLSLNGTVKNTQELLINNRTITLDQNNSFNETIVVSPGLTILEIDMSDSFGKTKQYTYHLYSTGETEEYERTYKLAKEKREQDDLAENQEIIN